MIFRSHKKYSAEVTVQGCKLRSLFRSPLAASFCNIPELFFYFFFVCFIVFYVRHMLAGINIFNFERTVIQRLGTAIQCSQKPRSGNFRTCTVEQWYTATCLNNTTQRIGYIKLDLSPFATCSPLCGS